MAFGSTALCWTLTIGYGSTDFGNINAGDNGNLFIDNTTDDYNTETDGFTVTLSLKIPIVAGTNSIKLSIADVGDNSYDSNFLIAVGSLQTTLLENDDSANVNPDGSKTINVLANDVNNTGRTLTVTHINGQAVIVDSIVTLESGQTVELNVDGSFTVVGAGDTENVNFDYTIESSTGKFDTVFVNLNIVHCFVARTLIETAKEKMLLEILESGDLIRTSDNGFQPFLWIGQREVHATGKIAPIEIATNVRRQSFWFQRRPTLRESLFDYAARCL